MISRKEYGKANNVCNQYCEEKDKNNSIYPYIECFRNEIKRAQNNEKNDNGLIK